jgi:hypothetical protein
VDELRPCIEPALSDVFELAFTPMPGQLLGSELGQLVEA